MGTGQEMGNALINVRREPKSWMDRYRRYELILDGSKVATVRRGQGAVLATQPGRHELFAKIDWCRSESVILDLDDGEEVSVSCDVRARPLSVLYWTTIGRARYLELALA